MVVEDNDLNRKLFCDVLRAQGYEVEPVADGETALAVARQVQPHLIIMDMQLPRISGVDLIEQAKQDLALAAIPVLAVTDPKKGGKGKGGVGTCEPGCRRYIQKKKIKHN